jgi:hypothetical protein
MRPAVDLLRDSRVQVPVVAVISPLFESSALNLFC